MTYRRCICHPDDLPGVGISSGWVTANSLCHPDDILFHFMSSGWLNWGWFLIRMSYGNVIMSSGWDTLPFLSHPDEIANFDFPQHAVALQRFRNIQRLQGSIGWLYARYVVLLLEAMTVAGHQGTDLGSSWRPRGHRRYTDCLLTTWWRCPDDKIVCQIHCWQHLQPLRIERNLSLWDKFLNTSSEADFTSSRISGDHLRSRYS